jgi:prepilin-type N-terminal cleavage/methylation domain-containing protein
MGKKNQSGFTLVEMTVALVVLAILALSIFALFNSVIRSMIIARRQAVAMTLATTQLEYLKSLPYDSLAVQGGSIYATTLLPASKTETVNGVKYTIKTSIGYVDDAYDGCGSYPTTALKTKYCRNYPPPSSAPSTDTNPADYKILNVVVTDSSNARLAMVDTEVTARVAESASTTGAIFITVLDASGSPVSGANVAVNNSTTSPVVALNDTTDGNGVAIFYNVPPTSTNSYVITASKSGYSSLATIAASGSLVPNYQHLKVLSQQSASLTMPIVPMIPNSLVVETTDVSGNPIGNVTVAIKGSYKKYTSTSDTQYYYDNTTPSDTRPVTDTSGSIAVSNLPPYGSYLFCGDNGAGGCKAGSTTYYLAAAVPYSGTNSLNPITIPALTATDTNMPYAYGSANYRQKVRLMLTTSSSFPRVSTVSPYAVSLSSGANLSSYLITITGSNLSGASASLAKDSVSYPGSSCTTSSTQLKCSFNLTSITTGSATISVTNSSGTLTLPATPLGGFNVEP